ncbi:MAG: hypothetical protein ABIA59_11745 [Candidatus Latescibacterota bacterium]
MLEVSSVLGRTYHMYFSKLWTIGQTKLAGPCRTEGWFAASNAPGAGRADVNEAAGLYLAAGRSGWPHGMIHVA